MVSWLRALLPAVPVILEVAREARRIRDQPEGPPAGTDGTGLEAALTRTNEALATVAAELERVHAVQAALERRLDVLTVVAWSVTGVLAMVVVGLIVRLAAG
jgi:hypothetical protein